MHNPDEMFLSWYKDHQEIKQAIERIAHLLEQIAVSTSFTQTAAEGSRHPHLTLTGTDIDRRSDADGRESSFVHEEWTIYNGATAEQVGHVGRELDAILDVINNTNKVG